MSETVKLVLGYVLSFVWMGLVMAIGELLNRKFRVEQELSRKISHLLSSACWIICYFFTGPTYHTVIINAIALVLVALTVFSGKLKYVDRNDMSKSFGLMYFCLSTLIVMTVTVFAYPELFATTGVAYYCLALGDGLAPIGKRIAGKHNIKVFGNKTLAGSIVVFTVSTLTALVMSVIFGLGYDALFMISLGALACVAELIGMKGTDNLILEFLVFAYAAMFRFGVIPQALEVAILIAAPMFIVDSVFKVLTPVANVITYLYLLVSVYCLGYAFLVTSIALFAMEAVISRTTSKRFNKIANVDTEKKGRGVRQILVNSIVILILTVLYKTLNILALAFVAFAVLTEELADSVASDIGRLAKKPPVDILRFKRVKPGISGGVSLIGTLSAMVCAAAGAAMPFIFFTFDYKPYLIIAGTALLGTIIDSVLGSCAQALYKCDVCGEHTEKTEHCGAGTTRVKGARCITNNAVNLISASLTAAIAVTIFFCCNIAV